MQNIQQRSKPRLNADEREDLSLSVALLVIPNLTVISGWAMLIPLSLQAQMVFGIGILCHFILLLFKMLSKFG